MYPRLVITKVVTDPAFSSTSNLPSRPKVIKEKSVKLML